MHKRAISRVTEDYAAFFLVSLGYEIWDCNFSSNTGEVDIVASKDDKLAFIEVRGRALTNFITAEEAISDLKLTKVEMAALAYLRKKQLSELDWQVDFLAISYTADLKVREINLLLNVTGF